MSSSGARILQRASEVLSDVIAENPHLGPKLGFLSGMLKTLGDEVDCYTAERLEQMNRMQAILKLAHESMPAPGWPHLEELVGFAPASPADYRVDVLDEHLVRLKRALIDVHAWAESVDLPQRSNLLREIWKHLDQHAAQASRHVRQMW